MKKTGNLIWMDLEMSGLDPERHVIMQVGCAVTDSELNMIAEGPALAVHQSERDLKSMDSWCIKQHGQSGLTDLVRNSRISLHEAEQEALRFLKKYCSEGKSPLCGNSIGQDRRFLVKYMPRLNDFFHYRNIDVSTIKELVYRWYGPRYQAPTKNKTHHVLQDIRDSIEELRHYRRTVFK